MKRGESGPSFFETAKWSAVMILVTALVAAVSIPILRLFGVGND